jgi:hypothetical protein
MRGNGVSLVHPTIQPCINRNADSGTVQYLYAAGMQCGVWPSLRTLWYLKSKAHFSVAERPLLVGRRDGRHAFWFMTTMDEDDRSATESGTIWYLVVPVPVTWLGTEEKFILALRDRARVPHTKTSHHPAC